MRFTVRIWCSSEARKTSAWKESFWKGFKMDLQRKQFQNSISMLMTQVLDFRWLSSLLIVTLQIISGACDNNSSQGQPTRLFPHSWLSVCSTFETDQTGKEFAKWQQMYLSQQGFHKGGGNCWRLGPGVGQVCIAPKENQPFPGDYVQYIQQPTLTRRNIMFFFFDGKLKIFWGGMNNTLRV